jgi:hypothetical protein
VVFQTIFNIGQSSSKKWRFCVADRVKFVAQAGVTPVQRKALHHQWYIYLRYI